MKIDFCVREVSNAASYRAAIRDQLERLHALTPISAAHVELAHAPWLEAPFRVRIVLVAGPEIQAAAADHTLGSAILHVIRDLERQICARQQKRYQRHSVHELKKLIRAVADSFALAEPTSEFCEVNQL